MVESRIYSFISIIIIMKEFCLVFLLSVLFLNSLGLGFENTVGYRIGQVTGYKKLKEFRKSQLFQVQCPQLDDSRPLKLLKLSGSHYDAGYDYGKLMGEQIKFTYETFFHSMLDTETQIKAVQLFLDWQYQYVRKQLPIQFIQQLKGITKAGREQKIPLLGNYFQRVLVISSFPGALEKDIGSILADEFLRIVGLHNEEFESFVQDNYLKLKEIIHKFIKKAAIHCSFFAVWGSRTSEGDLYTMRNLDWAENTGVNQNKLITVWNIDATIPHVTLGYPGIIGALTGMSAAGITVHEAGLSSHHSTEIGFQWTLRFRYIMMHAKNIEQATKIWKSTNNTLGMNFMIASAADLKENHPALVLETMRGYTAYILDYDSRQNGTIFKDPNTNKTFQAGYSMPEAVFRTNHAYDPIIVEHLRSKLESNSDTMIRYRILKDGFNWYHDNQILMGAEESINMTAVLGDKGSEKFLSCQNNFKGINVISVTYQPSQLKMWAAFEYGFHETFRSACCGVYVEMDMTQWLKPTNNLKVE